MSNAQQIKYLRQQIAALEEEDRQAKLAQCVTKQEAELATWIHETFCNHNHTDGCSWGYEFENDKPRWASWAHAEYLKKARTVLHRLGDKYKSTAEIQAVIESAKELVELCR